MSRLITLVLTLALTSCSAPPHNPDLPKPLSQARPDYPVYAFTHSIEGKVSFDFDVDAEGKVSEMRITESVPDHLFDDTVIRAVSQWRYEKGKPAKNLHMTVQLKINKPY
nr:TonB family protein [uncultured Erwinia sp.]